MKLHYACHAFVNANFTATIHVVKAHQKNSRTFAAMFERLQKKWKVGPFQLLIILVVFALGGSATGYLGKKIMDGLNIEQGVSWVIIYIIVITILWPISVLVVSIPFGQFPFFSGYLKRMAARMKLMKANPSVKNITHRLTTPITTQPAHRIAIFASGAGSNAGKIIEHFRNHPLIEVGLIVCNKPTAGVLGIAEENGIPTLLIDKEEFFRGNAYVEHLKNAGISFIVLAGFLWKIPQKLIDNFRNRIINIHPALLPNYGGKGMYGNFVHEAVINSGDLESGITIHYVDEHYDNGDIIFQARVPVQKK